jgi:ferrochelatase
MTPSAPGETAAPVGAPGVLLVSHGTVDDLDDLGAFVTNVRRGRPPGAEMLAELRHRYEAIGGRSPLNATTAEVARKLEQRLGVRVGWANRLWRPYVREVLADLAGSGAKRVAVVPLAPFSAHVYEADARRAAEGLPLELACAPAWGLNAKLVAAFAARIQAELARGTAVGPPHLLMTAHSLPVALIERGDPYERQVRATAEAVATEVGRRLGTPISWSLAFQSQGFAEGGMRWLGPDLREAVGALPPGAHLVIAAIGFLADHVETLYDLDVEARALAGDRGLSYARAASLDADDDLVDVLAEVARPLLRHD